MKFYRKKKVNIGKFSKSSYPDWLDSWREMKKSGNVASRLFFAIKTTWQHGANLNTFQNEFGVPSVTIRLAVTPPPPPSPPSAPAEANRTEIWSVKPISEPSKEKPTVPTLEFALAPSRSKAKRPWRRGSSSSSRWNRTPTTVRCTWRASPTSRRCCAGATRSVSSATANRWGCPRSPLPGALLPPCPALSPSFPVLPNLSVWSPTCWAGDGVSGFCRTAVAGSPTRRAPRPLVFGDCARLLWGDTNRARIFSVRVSCSRRRNWRNAVVEMHSALLLLSGKGFT